ncbi:MAG: hypothetical protein ACI86H_001203 [bacterium]|jgi:hypothetical protein
MREKSVRKELSKLQPKLEKDIELRWRIKVGEHSCSVSERIQLNDEIKDLQARIEQLEKLLPPPPIEEEGSLNKSV